MLGWLLDHVFEVTVTMLEKKGRSLGGSELPTPCTGAGSIYVIV